MYGDANIHRPLVCIGCLGLAAMMPYGTIATWLAVLLAVLPLALLELGAEMVDQGEERKRPGLRLAGWHFQAYGALLFLAPFSVFATHLIRQQVPGGLIFTAIAAVGLPSCLIVIFRWRHALLGNDPRGKERKPDSTIRSLPLGLRGKLILAALDPLLLGSFGILLAAAGAYLLLGGEALDMGEVFFVFGLLAAPVLLAIASGLDGWEARVPAIRFGPVHEALQNLILLGVMAAALAAAIIWIGQPWIRWALFSGGGLLALGTIVMATLRLRRSPLPYRLRISEEGLLEEAQNGAVIYPWPAVLSCSATDLFGHAGVLLQIDDTEPLTWRAASDGAKLGQGELFERRRAAMAENRQWLGADLFALPAQLDTDPAAFAEKIDSLIETPSGAGAPASRDAEDETG